MNTKQDVFQAILQSKIEHFVFDFQNSSKKMFYDAEGKLFHPGEFGTYREKICIDLLRNVVPRRLDIGTGFIIDAEGNVSTQCDIVIFDSDNTPLLENEERQRFYPIETVVAVGEVKSTLKKSELKNALIKLSKVKKMRDTLRGANLFVYRDSALFSRSIVFDAGTERQDGLFTFLICDKLDFQNDSLVDEFGELYQDIDRLYWHNFILSLSDGAFLYNLENNRLPNYSYAQAVQPNLNFQNGKPMYNRCMKLCVSDRSEAIHENDRYSDVYACLYHLYRAVSIATIVKPDLWRHILGYADCRDVRNEKVRNPFSDFINFPTSLKNEFPPIDGENSGKTCSVHLRGRFEDNNQEFISTYTTGSPWIYVCNMESMIYGLDKEIASMKIGEKRTVHIPAKEAYGEYDDSLVYKREYKDIDPRHHNVNEGTQIQLTDSLNRPFIVTVREKDDYGMTFDLNSFYAGRNVIFDIELVGVSERMY